MKPESTYQASGIGSWSYYWPDLLYPRPSRYPHPFGVFADHVQDRDINLPRAQYCRLTADNLGKTCESMKCIDGPDDLSGYLCNYQRNLRYKGYVGQRLIEKT